MILKSIRPDGRKFFLLISIILTIALFTSSHFSFAQAPAPSQSLAVSPPSQELKADPGQVISAKAKLRNGGNSAITVKTRIEDFVASGDEGQVTLAQKTPYSIVSWSKVAPEEFVLGAGETKEVIATISVPKDGAGGRYGSFVFSVGGQGVAGTAGVGQEVASLFLIRISGPVDEVLSLEKFSSPSFLEFGPVPFSLTYKNSGNVHLKPFGLINVKDVFGRTVADVVVKGQTNIFPGASRVVTVNLDKKWLVGPYTAQAILNYGSKNTSLGATTTFFAFPVRLAVIVLIILFVLYLFRRRLSKALKAMMGR